jgi:MtN3 and saliva related transmembrane protein
MRDPEKMDIVSHTETIGFWAAILTTVAFAPQVIRTWRVGGDELSWLMLTCFGTGVGLWFVYGYLRMSGPLMLANGLTGLQILVIIGVKFRRATRPQTGRKTGPGAAKPSHGNDPAPFDSAVI